MQQLIITRMMANTPYSIRLTNEELERAYRIKQKDWKYQNVVFVYSPYRLSQ